LWDQQYAGNTDIGGNEVKELLGKKYFDFPKPTLLMKRVLEHGSNPDCIVMDFFSGSSSMADAVMQLNAQDGGSRRFLMVQLPEKCRSDFDAKSDGYNTICDIALARIKAAGRKIAAEVEESSRQLQLGEETKKLPDIGFRVLKLDESGIIRPEGGQLLMDVVKPDRTDLDVIFECMLKWGLELSLPVERAEAAGYPVYTVAAGELVCCMERGLTVGALEAVAAMEPRRVLILDSVLDDTLKLNAKAIFDRGTAHGTEIELRTV
jgi:adenine-specific DNA-methyltransferase